MPENYILWSAAARYISSHARARYDVTLAGGETVLGTSYYYSVKAPRFIGRGIAPLFPYRTLKKRTGPLVTGVPLKRMKIFKIDGNTAHFEGCNLSFDTGYGQIERIEKRPVFPFFGKYGRKAVWKK